VSIPSQAELTIQGSLLCDQVLREHHFMLNGNEEVQLFVWEGSKAVLLYSRLGTYCHFIEPGSQPALYRTGFRLFMKKPFYFIKIRKIDGDELLSTYCIRGKLYAYRTTQGHFPEYMIEEIQTLLAVHV
jgi:hypothetical protein